MKMIRSIIDKLMNKRGVESVPSQEWLRGDDLDDTQLKLVNPYSQCAWIYVAISVLAESVAHVPFRISRGRGKGETLVESGPVYDLFRNPHPSMSRALFWQTLVSWEALRGEFFVVPMDQNGQPVPLGWQHTVKPIQMLPLNPDSFAHIISGHDIVGWRFSGGDSDSPVQQQVLLPEEVVHWRNFNPYLFWRGLSPLTVAMLPATADYAAAQFMKGLMINNGDAGLIVTTEDPMSEEQKAQVRASLNDRKRRAGTADKPLFLCGKIKVEKPVISSADLQFLENRKLSRQEIGAIFKVPESMMGFAGQKSALSAGSAIEQDRLTFIENTLGGLCRRLEAAMEPIIKSFDSNLHGWFDLDSLPIMQAARRDRMITAAKAFEMGVPFNELNQVYDLGFESLPWGNRGYVSNNLQEIGTKASKSARVGEQVQSTEMETLAGRFLALLDEGKPESDPYIRESAKRKSGKLSRFFFEQRSRALAALETRLSSENPISEPLLNVENETAMLLPRMMPLLADDFTHAKGERDWEPHARALLTEMVGTKLQTLDLCLQNAANEKEQNLPAKVKRLYQDFAADVEQIALDITEKVLS